MNGTENAGFEMDEKGPPDAGKVGAYQEASGPVASMSKVRIFKNLFVICIAFLLLFGAFQALGNLQSTMNIAGNVGTTSQSVIYASLILSSFFLPTVVIRKLGCKLALGFCMLMYTPYIAAQFKPEFYTMIPAAIILGFGAAPMWSAKCTYLNEIGFRYSKYVKLHVDAIVVRFFGIFFMFFQSSQIVGNLISYFILNQGAAPDANQTVCGVQFTHDAADNTSNIATVEADLKNILVGIYLAMGVSGGLLVLAFLDPIQREFQSTENDGKSAMHLLMATFRHLKKKKQLILIPITIYSGLEQAFFLSEYTKSYVACAWGISKIGLVAISFGVVNAGVSLSSGPLVKLVNRAPIFIMAALVNLGVVIGLIFWDPNKEQSVVFFVIAGLWGLGDAVWQTQINAFYGILFQGEEEPAFANYRMWESLGFVMAFAYEKISVPAKMAVLLAFLVVGMAGYLFIECVMIKKEKARTENEKPS